MIDEKRLYQILGERVRRFRDDQPRFGERMTQAELAKLVGLERTSITNIEKGNQKVPLHVLFRLCEILKVSVGELLPALIEVQLPQDQQPFRELCFAGDTYKTTPLIAEAVTALLKTGDENGSIEDGDRRKSD